MVTQGSINSQYDGPEVEELGLLKFDILGLKTITVVDKTVKLIEERHGKYIDVDRLEPEDPEIFKLFNGHLEMDTKGIFQFESDGMQKLLKDINVDRFNDLVVANALYRPGPMNAGMHKMYCDFKHKRKKIKYLHPKMGEVLNDTFGIMVFQESVMKVSQVVAGFTGGQADTLRKAVGKKKPELLKQQRELFVKGCFNNNVEKSIAEKIFEQIDYFAGYGFNKSHSAAYSFLSYQTAYLKVKYPIEFMCNLMSSEISNNDKDRKLISYANECDRMGIAIFPQKINLSGLKYTIEKGNSKSTGDPVEYLRKPLTTLKGVGAKAVTNIVEHQPFTSLEDLLRRTEARIINKTIMEALIDHGCFPKEWGSKDRIRKDYPEIKKIFEKERKALKKEKEKMEEYEGSLFGEEFDYSGEDIEI
jgi:DNA polymerase-3 subunit alpha